MIVQPEGEAMVVVGLLKSKPRVVFPGVQNSPFWAKLLW